MFLELKIIGWVTVSLVGRGASQQLLQYTEGWGRKGRVGRPESVAVHKQCLVQS